MSVSLGRAALLGLACMLTTVPAGAQLPAPTPQSPAPTPQSPSGQAPIIQTPVPPSQQYRGGPGSVPRFQAAPGTPPAPGFAPVAPTPTLPGAPLGTTPQAGPAIIPNTWIPQGSATLQALDKVNALSATLTVKVGQSAKFGSLQIAVQGCSIRPPDQPANAAAYLVVTDTHPDAPGFKGWMLKKEPQVNMLEHPIYDLRVTGCTA